MRVEPLIADAAPLPVASHADAEAFARALDGLGRSLQGAQEAEDAFSTGNGSLQDAVYLRARADVALAAAAAAAGRLIQAVQALSNMQV